MKHQLDDSGIHIQPVHAHLGAGGSAARSNERFQSARRCSVGVAPAPTSWRRTPRELADWGLGANTETVLPFLYAVTVAKLGVTGEQTANKPRSIVLDPRFRLSGPLPPMWYADDFMRTLGIRTESRTLPPRKGFRSWPAHRREILRKAANEILAFLLN